MIWKAIILPIIYPNKIKRYFRGGKKEAMIAGEKFYYSKGPEYCKSHYLCIVPLASDMVCLIM